MRLFNLVGNEHLCCSVSCAGEASYVGVELFLVFIKIIPTKTIESAHAHMNIMER